MALPPVLLLVFLHLPAVQRAAFDRAAEELAGATGLRLQTAELRLRLWPARLEAVGLRLDGGDRPVARLDRLRATWRWSELLGTPPRVESLELEGLDVDLRELPELPERPLEPDAEPVDPWRVLEVGRFQLEGGQVAAAAGGLGLGARGLRLSGALVDGLARLRFEAHELEADRAGRRLLLGPLDLEARGSADGIVVERCRLDGELATLEATGTVVLAEAGVVARGSFQAAGDLAGLVGWWDPELLPVVQPRGRVQLEGSASVEPGGQVELEVDHRGAPFEVAGYGFDRLRITSSGGEARLLAGGAGWGAAEVDLTADRRLRAVLHLDQAPLGPALAFAPAELAAALPQPLRVSGELEAALPLPPELKRLEAQADLHLSAPELEAKLAGRVAGGGVEVGLLEVDVPGAQVRGEGSLRFGGAVDLRLEMAIADPSALAEVVTPYLPAPLPVSLGGGPVTVEARASGPLASPDMSADLAWQGPEVSGHRVELVTASLAGTFDRLDWRLEVEPVEGSRLAASGSAEPRAGRAAGEWLVEAPDLPALATLAPAAADLPLGGSLRGGGGFLVGDGTWAVSGVLEGRRLTWAEWCVDDLRVEVEADPEAVRVRSLEAGFAGAALRGRGETGLSGVDAAIAARLTLEGLDLGRLPVEVPPQVAGTVSAGLDLRGTVARPVADLVVDWVPRAEDGPVGPISVRAAIAAGVLHAFAERLDTAAGPVAVEATLPLGGFARPAWLWPDAPTGPVEGHARAVSLRSAPLMAALGVGDPSASLTTDLSLDVLWDLADPGQRKAELVLDGLVVDSAVESLRSEGPVMLWLDGSQVRLAPLVLAGSHSRLEVAASAVDLETREVFAHADMVLDASVARLLPVPLQGTGPFRLTLDLSGSLDAPNGAFTLDHRGGRLVMRDPPVELTDLTLSATLEGGVLTVESGGAGMNRGRIEFGGGWDPASGQGLVLELENVAFVVAGGMVTRWSGVLAVEPEPGRVARVTGELVLDGGIWEQPVDLAASFLSPSATPVAADDPTHDILLDLQVRGRGGVRVDNNLGRFDVSWGVLQVGGTVAQPVLEGEVRIAAGGQIALTGKPIEVQRGTIEFTGEAGAEPRIELIPKEDLLEGTGGEFDAEMVAMKGLAGGLGKALGLENRTLQPAEIAVETETDPGTRFSVGQRLSRQIALFFSADLADPQDRVTTLQVWNLRYLRGLALQAFNESAGQEGGAVVERLSWGGTEATVERPVIHRVKLEGEWPIPKRKLRKASGLDRGEPFDDIFLFVGEVRMERALAEAGYYDARVDGRAEGSESLPTLVFACDPGPRQRFSFAGDRLPKAVRREAIGLYQSPPLEDAAFEVIRDTLTRRLAVEGFPNASVSVERRDDLVVVEVRKGRGVKLLGPVVEGVSAELEEALARALGSPAQLAQLLHDPERGSPWVERLVHGRGYDRARLTRVWAEPVTEKKSRVHLEVDLGPRAVVGEVRLEGSDPLGVVSSPDFRVTAGMPLDRGEVDSAVSRLRRRYLEEGYFGVEARWRAEEVEPGQWNVAIRVAPGTQRTVGKITFSGLRHLSEDLLRATLPVKEGDLLNAASVDTGVSQLASFGPVERVRATTSPLAGGGSEVEIEVTEKPRWTVGLGLRWGTDTGSEVLFDLRDDNLFNRGFSANLRGHVGGDRQYLALITELPPPPGRRLRLGLTLTYVDEFVGESVQEMRSRATFNATYTIGRHSAVRSYLGVRRTRTVDESQFIPQDETSDFVTVGGQYALDRLDDPFDPRSGFALTVDLSWNTEISDLNRDFLRSLVGGAVVMEPLPRWTWSQAVRLGTSEPLTEDVLPSGKDARFFAGGQASIRGFPLDSVGPVDFFTGDPAGGGALITLKEELQIPLWRALRLAVFADAGNVWESWGTADWGEVAVGAGLGLRLGTPIGPVYVDAGWPVVDPAEQGGSTQYYFGIGRTF